MKLYLSAICLGLLSFSGFAQQITKANYFGEESSPYYIEFDDNVKLSDVESILKEEIHQDENVALSPIQGILPDKLGFTHQRFHQTYLGVPIFGSSIVVHSKNDQVNSISGKLVRDLAVVNQASLTPEAAVQKAREYVGADYYMWEIPANEEFIKREQNDPEASFYPEVEEVFFPSEFPSLSGELRLAYQMDIYASSPRSRQDLFVDAMTGDILFSNEKLHEIDEPGTGETAYSGNRPIITYRPNTSADFELRDMSRGGGIFTHDCMDTDSYANAIIPTNSTNDWDYGNAVANAILDAHWGTEMTYDFYALEHGWNSYDNADSPLLSYVHFSLIDFGYGSNNNAFWDGSRMTYGDGDGINYNPLTAIDVISHEITHGVIQNSADLVYSYEPGALNESFADIFGTCVEYYAKPEDFSWLLGDEMSLTGSAIRSMSDPNSLGDPDTYQGAFWNFGSTDNGGVHTNSGVQNYWFYLLSEGGSGINDNGDAYSVIGIGMEDAWDIAFRNLTVYLNTSSEYAEARAFSIQAAEDLFGQCSPQVAAVTDAWHAVGIGAAFDNLVQADFQSSATYSCVVPGNIQFFNNSNNANSYLWDFGDASTSIEESPLHTYTAAGSYDVTLIAYGNTLCNSSDTTYSVIPIVIDDGAGLIPAQCQPVAANPNPDGGILEFNFETINNPSTGSLASYQDFSCQFTTTITEGLQYPMDVLLGASGYLAMWIDLDNDGGFTDSELVYSSSTMALSHSPVVIIPAATIFDTSLRLRVMSSTQPITSACLTDNYGQAEDYTVVITDNVNPPIALFDAVPNPALENENITVQDLSLNAPTSWEWSFPGSDILTSTDQNPVVSYSAIGTYDVELIVTNAHGSDTLFIPDYIHIVNQFNMCDVTYTEAASGIFFDTGGPTGNYGNSDFCELLIAPPCALGITLDVVAFNVESGWDYLTIYDGADATAPQIGNYTGTNIPATISSTGSELFIRWDSDGSITSSGFEIHWNALIGSQNPVDAIAQADDLNPAFGQAVLFNDLSVETPYLWSWEFGDGMTSNLQNPTHSYTTAGPKTVVMSVTNCVSQDSDTLYLDVQQPSNFSISPSTIDMLFPFCEDSITQSVWISNGGGGDLLFEFFSELTDDFESASPNSDIWSFVSGDISPGCATNSGTGALYFNNAGIREAVTIPFTHAQGTELGFHLFYASGTATPCEAVSGTEYVLIEYSTDGGASYTQIDFYPSFTPFFTFAPVTVTTPLDAVGVPTIYRIRQNNHDGIDTDHWAIDDFYVTGSSSVVSTDPSSGTVLANDSLEVEVTVYRNGLTAGDYTTSIQLVTNDPQAPSAIIPINYTIEGEGILSYSEPCLIFETIQEFSSITDTVFFSNTGCAPLDINTISSSHPDFQFEDFSGLLEPNETIPVVVTFSPSALGAYNEMLNFIWDGIDSTLCLSGVAVGAPVMSFTPTSIDETTTGCDDLITIPITVYNTGLGDLDVEILIDGVSGGIDYIFYDDFEDGDISDWNGNGNNFFVSTVDPYNGVYNLSNTGSGGHHEGISASFTAGQHDYFACKLKSEHVLTSTGGSCYVVLGDDGIDTNNGILFMYATEDIWHLYGNGVPDLDVPRSLTGYDVFEFTNIDYVNHDFDVWINGVLMAEDFPFRANSSEISTLNLYSFNSSEEARYDEIQVGGTAFIAGADWITADPDTLNVAVNDSTVFWVTLDASGLPAGTHLSDIILQSNDPANPLDTIPVSFTVVGTPEIALSETCLDFGSILATTTAVDSVMIYNNGCDSLHISDIIPGLPEYTTDISSAIIPPWDSLNVTVTFAPLTMGNYDTDLLILNNDVDTLVCLIGTGQAAPSISVDPEVLDVTIVQCNDSTFVPLTIYNTGEGPLTWEVSGVVSLSDDFESGTNPDLWSIIDGGVTSASCGVNNGTNALYFDGNINRSATTVDLNISSTGTIQFALKFGTGASPCEAADTGENVVLEYSTNGGVTWTAIQTYLTSAYTNFTLIDENIPLLAQSPATSFRWRQVDHSGAGTDNWSIDDVSIDVISNSNVTPDSGTIAVGDSTVVQVLVSADGLLAGNHTSQVLINSNDPANPVVAVPINLTVVGAPEISMSETCLDFGSILATTTAVESFTIYNTGCAEMNVSDIYAGLPEYTASPTTLTIPPNDSASVDVTFYPLVMGTYDTDLFIINDDTDTLICLIGTGQAAPSISVLPEQLDVTIIECNDSTLVPLTIYNTGEGPLDWEISGVVSLSDDFETGTNADLWSFIDGGVTSAACGVNAGASALYFDGNINRTATTVDLGISSNGTIQFALKFGTGSSPCEDADAGEDVVLEYSTNGGVNWTLIQTYFSGSYPNFTLIEEDIPVLAQSPNTRFRWRQVDHSGGGTDNWSMDDVSIDVISNGNVTPDSGTIAVGDSTVVQVMVSADGLYSGTYTSQVLINSNDPANPTLAVPINLTVIGSPEIALSQTCLDFGSILATTTAMDSVTIYNTGCADLNVSDIFAGLPEYSSDLTSLTIPPDDSATVVVTFAPLSMGTYNTDLFIINNDTDTLICLTGMGQAAPSISVLPEMLDVTILECNDSTLVPLTIYNVGEGPLDWEVSGLFELVDDFETGTNPDLWDSIEGGVTSSACGVANGANALYFDGAINRIATTTELNLSAGGSIGFSLKFGTGSSPCEDADAGEDVALEYSINGGATWTNIQTYFSGGYPNFTAIQVDVPIEAETANTMFRWRQTDHSGAGTDNWSIDDVSIDVVSNSNVTPDSGTIAPGDSTIVQVMVSAEGLLSGLHTSQVLISSNDPANPGLVVPINLTLVGSPEIGLMDSCLIFDPIQENTLAVDSITLYNTGCADLVISDIISGIPEFYADPTTLIIPPNDSAMVGVTFAPTSLGLYDSFLEILNNDSDTMICVSGEALGAPIISYDPTFITDTVFGCNDSIVVPVWVYNTGLGDLDVDIYVEGEEGWTDYVFYDDFEDGDISDWTVIGNNFFASMNEPYNGSYCVENNQGAGHRQGIYTNFEAGQHDYVSFKIWSEDISTSTSASTSYINIGNNNMSSSSGRVMFLYAHDDVWIVYADISLQYEIPRTQGVWDHFEFKEIDYANQEYDLWFNGELIYPDFPFRDFSNDLSELHLYNFESSYTAKYDEIQIGGTEILAGPDWVTVDPDSVNVAVNDSTLFYVTLDASGLPAGTHYSNVILESNDPLSPFDTIPVCFTVLGGPEIALSDTCLDFGSIMATTTAVDSLTIYNTGCDSLFITDIIPGLPEYTTDISSIVIPPWDSTNVVVSFSPLAEGIFNTDLLILNNYSDTLICLTGAAQAAPIIEVDPEILEVTVYNCHDSTLVPLTIYNTGEGPLDWNIEGLINLSTDFESGIDPSVWASVEGGVNSASCGTANGIGALYFDGGINRIATTVDLNIGASAEVTFSLKIGEGASPCEAADGGEDVVLEYSTNGGAAWTIIQTYFTGAYPDFTVIQETVPVLAQSPNTAFRWRQLSHSGSGTDNWSIDDVSIEIISSSDVTPDSGIIQPGDSTVVMVSVNGNGLSSGVYESAVLINSNDPSNPLLSVPLIMTVLDGPLLTLSDTCLHFGTIATFTSAIESLTIYNEGCDDLVVSDISAASTDFTPNPTSGVILPGDSLVLDVTFSPTADGIYSSFLQILNNYSDTTICLTGTAIGECCPGCMDTSACNYDPDASQDDGSCILPDGCVDPLACNFDVNAMCDDGSCDYESCFGCTYSIACNYDPEATEDDGSCLLPDGCTDLEACNYSSAAQCDNGTCFYPDGCLNPFACNYDSTAQCDDGSCEFESCAGCTDSEACNYNSEATTDDGSCLLPDGCVDSEACNYSSAAQCDDGSCIYPDGCTNPNACNFDSTALCDDGSCEFETCLGCTDSEACNYNSEATIDDASCIYPDGCVDSLACNFDSSALCDDGSCEYESCLGCTDSEALNYDSTALIDDGSCFYDCEFPILVMIPFCESGDTTGFYIELECFGMGNVAPYTLTNNVNSEEFSLDSLGVYNLGPFENGSNVIFEITSDDYHTCITNSIFVSDDCVGIEELIESSFELFPNPSTGLINLTVGNYSGAMQLQLFDLTGKLVYEDQLTVNASAPVELNLERLSDGPYFITAQMGNAFVTKRFVIVR